MAPTGAAALSAAGAATPRRLQAGWVVLLLAPLAVWPWGAEAFALPKALAAAVGATLVLSTRSSSALDRRVTLVVSCGAVVLLLAALLSATPVAALVGRYPRYEGAAVLGTYVAVLAAGARLRPYVARLEPLTVWTLAPAAGLVLLVAVIEGATGSGLRAGSLLGNATDVGVWSAMCGLWLLTAASGRWVWVARAGALAAVAATAVSGSRSALVALVVGLVVVLVRQWQRRDVRTVALAFALVSVAFVVVAPGTLSRVTGADQIATETSSGRLILWQDSARLIVDHPVLGIGPSSFVDRIGSAHTERWAAQVGPANPPDSPHDVVLQAGAAGGVVLVVLLVMLGVLVALAAWRSSRASTLLTGTSAALAGYAAAVLLNFTTPSTTTFACLSAGLVCAVPRSSMRGRTVPWLGAVGVVVTGALAVVLAFAVVGETLVRQADQALAAGRAADAENLWRTVSALRPGDVDIALRHGRALTSAVDAGLVAPGACLGPTGEAVRALPGSSEAATDRAHCLEVNRRFGEADEVLAGALSRDPVNVDLWLLRGVIAAEKGDTNAAVRHLTRAAELRPTASEPWADLAAVLRLSGDAAGAAKAAAKAAALAGASAG